MGLPLALSDVLTNPSDPAEALNRFLGAIELSFENCLAFVTGHPDEEGFAKVEFQSSSAANVFTKIKFSEGIAEAIGGGREEGEISDYLFVKSINSRKEFNSSEKAALQQAAPGVGSLLSLIQEQRKAA